MALFHKNSVITGQLDSFCLLCETHLKGEDEIKHHTEDRQHKEKLDATNYLDKYKDDGIRKVKQGYYCEYCNSLFATAMQVRTHVTKQEHVKDKNMQQLKLKDDMVFAFNKIAINEDAWQGLIDGSCVLCNVEYLEKSDHKTSPTHILKLVQSSVELEPSGRIYRKVDNFLYCITCNALFALETLNTHFEHSDHVKFYNECCQTYKQIQALSAHEATKNKNNVEVNEGEKNTQLISNDKQAEEKKTNESKEVQLNVLDPKTTTEFKASETTGMIQLRGGDKNNVEVKKDGVKNTQVTSNGKQTEEKETYGSNEIDELNVLDPKANTDSKTSEKTRTNTENQPSGSGICRTIQKDFDNDKKNENSLNSTKKTIKAKKFADANKLTYKEGTSSAFCGTCNVTISSSLKRMKEHVAETAHQKTAEDVNKVLSFTKSMKDYVDDAVTIEQESFFFKTRLVIVNEKFCLSLISFSLMTPVSQLKIRCLVCEINLDRNSYVSHHETQKHKEALLKTLVVIAFHSEFIREIRPGLYHCGFCNIIEGSWIGLKNHLYSVSHKDTKASAIRKLEELLPDVREHKMRQYMTYALLSNLFN